jgi:WD40-like Beta Propeller Repeat
MKLGYIFLSLIFSACNRDNKTVNPNPVIEFGLPVKVEMIGYSGNIMEPFISRDGKTLLFNNLNAAPENTNLHWATKINDTTFQYNGEITGVNTADLEGVPTLDNIGNLYFVSTHNYSTTLSTIYQCNFLNGTAANVQLTNGVSKLQPGWLNFDVEVSADGQTIYFVDSKFDQTGNPATADLVIAKRTNSGFQRLSSSDGIMQNINSNELEYAACISVDQLELYFTRLAVPFTATSSPEIFLSTRQNVNEPFNTPAKVQSITGFVEGATIAPDQKTLYYHKKENNKYVLYLVRKK